MKTKPKSPKQRELPSFGQLCNPGFGKSFHQIVQATQDQTGLNLQLFTVQSSVNGYVQVVLGK